MLHGYIAHGSCCRFLDDFLFLNPSLQRYSQQLSNNFAIASVCQYSYADKFLNSTFSKTKLSFSNFLSSEKIGILSFFFRLYHLSCDTLYINRFLYVGIMHKSYLLIILTISFINYL